jgi:hypothetical protein
MKRRLKTNSGASQRYIIGFPLLLGQRLAGGVGAAPPHQRVEITSKRNPSDG